MGEEYDGPEPWNIQIIPLRGFPEVSRQGLQGEMDAVQETTILERLFKHRLKAGTWSLRVRPGGGSGRDKDGRIADLALPEPTDKFNPAHSRLGVVNHEAAVPGQVGIRQDLVRPLVEAHGQTLEFKGEFQ
jgi:hypothetical protein